MSIKRFLRNSLRSAGWDLKKFNPLYSADTQLVRQLSAHRIDVVLDVGANCGQFAEKLRDAGFSGRIVSFEPSTAAHESLNKQALGDANWVIAPRMALGHQDGTITLNLAANSASSSVLPMLPAHAAADPESRYIGSENVDLRTLDSVEKDFVTKAERIFLKLDVQGFEHKVLQGAEEFLNRVLGIQIELSLLPLYEGEHLFDPMLHYLEDLGYDLWSVIPGFVDPATSRLLQVDAIFFRK